MSERPRRRRRATRPATGGVDQRGGKADPTLDDVEDDVEEDDVEEDDRGRSDADGENSRWLREQRPPHWE